MVSEATTKPRAERRPLDQYDTPDALALACCKALRENLIAEPLRILEPSCGGGSFLRAVNQTWPEADLFGGDVEPRCEGPGRVIRCDFLDSDLLFGNALLLGNPPFALAEEFVRRAFECVREGGVVAFLLRLSFLAGRGRAALYREHPLAALWPIAGRPSFTGGGTDSSEYGLFAWRKGSREPGRIYPPLEWK